MVTPNLSYQKFTMNFQKQPCWQNIVQTGRPEYFPRSLFNTFPTRLSSIQVNINQDRVYALPIISKSLKCPRLQTFLMIKPKLRTKPTQQARNPYRKGKLSTADLLTLTNLDQERLHFQWSSSRVDSSLARKY